MQNSLFMSRLAFLSSFAIFGSAQSEECICLESSYPCTQVDCGCCCASDEFSSSLDRCEGYTPAYYDLVCDWGISLSVDFLYWYGRESNLTYAGQYETVSTQDERDPTSTALVPTDYEYISTDWEPGIRVGLGLNLNCDGWDVRGEWTYYKNTKSSKVTSPVLELPLVVGDVLLGTPWSEFGMTSPQFNQIKANWKFRWNGLDLELGRRYWLSRCFAFRPSVGLRGGWTKTDFDLKGTLAELENGGADQINIENDNCFRNSFWGGGLLTGVEPSFYFTPCFSLFGGMNLALLWGKFKYKLDCDQFRFTDLNNMTDVLVEYDYSYDLKTDSYGMQPVFDLALGLRYEMNFCCDRFLLVGEAGWEHHIWLDHNQRYYRNYNGNQTTGDPAQIIDLISGEEIDNSVDFGGLVVRLAFDF